MSDPQPSTFSFLTGSTDGLASEIAALQARTVASVAATLNNYPASELLTAILPTGGVLLTASTANVTLPNPQTAAFYVVAWETGLNVTVPASSGSGNPALVLPYTLLVTNFGAGLGAVTYTVTGGGAVATTPPDISGSGYVLQFFPGPPELHTVGDWIVKPNPAAPTPEPYAALTSPDATTWYVTVDNSGVLSTSTTAP